MCSGQKWLRTHGHGQRGRLAKTIGHPKPVRQLVWRKPREPLVLVFAPNAHAKVGERVEHRVRLQAAGGRDKKQVVHLRWEAVGPRHAQRGLAHGGGIVQASATMGCTPKQRQNQNGPMTGRSPSHPNKHTHTHNTRGYLGCRPPIAYHQAVETGCPKCNLESALTPRRRHWHFSRGDARR